MAAKIDIDNLIPNILELTLGKSAKRRDKAAAALARELLQYAAGIKKQAPAGRSPGQGSKQTGEYIEFEEVK